MTGGLLQLVSSGGIDRFFTKSPTVTFFNAVYQRHTSFYKYEDIAYFDLSFGKKNKVKLNKSGDLLRNIFLYIKLPQLLGTNQKNIHSENNHTTHLYNSYVIHFIISIFFKRYICSYNVDPIFANNLNFLHNLKYDTFNLQVDCEFKNYYETNVCNTFDDYIEKYISLNPTKKNEINLAYQIFITYEKEIPQFKSTYYALTKQELIEKILDDMDIGNLRHTIQHFIKNIVRDINIDHNFEINYETTINDLGNLDLDNFLINKTIKYSHNEKVIIEEELNWVHNIGHEIIKDIKLTFNGKVIDHQDSDTFNISRDLLIPSSKLCGYNRMIGNCNPTELLVPLNFWFQKTKNFLPVFMMHNTEIEITITFQDYSKLIIPYSKDLIFKNLNLSGYLILEYMNISNLDKKMISQVDHIIEYYRFGKYYTDKKSIRLFLKGIIKEIYWKNKTHTTNLVRINFDGIIREDYKSNKFYGNLLPYYYHTKSEAAGYNIYSFSLYPDRNIISGEVNSNDIKEIEFIFSENVNSVKYYIVYYGILTICDGIAIMNDP